MLAVLPEGRRSWGAFLWVPSHSTLPRRGLCPTSKEGGCSESFSLLLQGSRDSSCCQHEVDIAPSAVPSWLSWDLPVSLHLVFCSAAEEDERGTMRCEERNAVALAVTVGDR